MRPRELGYVLSGIYPEVSEPAIVLFPNINNGVA